MAAKVTHIASRDNALLLRLRRLARQPGGYRRQGEMLLEGEHLCQAWVASGSAAPSVALIAASAWPQGGAAALARTAASVAVVADAALAGVGILETATPLAFVVALPPAPAVLSSAPSVVLDRVQDAGNVGSILRSAAALGVEQVIALRGTASLWSPKVVRAGMGAHFRLRLVEGDDEAALAALAVPMLTTSSHAGQALPDAALPWPCAWVFGNEGEGVAAGLHARCTAPVRIPQPGGQESLNVAVAAAICLYESARRRL
ncbi:MAG: RNA methyltransferase [Caldimonas sp.]